MLASRRLTLALTYAGALPFLFLLPVKLPFLQGGDTLAMFIAYGAIISSFMAGSLWGLLQARETPPFVQIIGSNVLALISWLSLLIEPGRAALLIQLATFISLLTVERTPPPAWKKTGTGNFALALPWSSVLPMSRRSFSSEGH